MKTTVPFALVAALSCATESLGPPVEPTFESGKADVGSSVLDRGPLIWDVPAEGELVMDLEFHGYQLDVRAGAVVSLEVTQRGTSRSLDATLFVYGPHREESGYGTSAVAVDQDSGWGRLPRLSDLTLAEGGRYLVVVGSHDARGRGRYRALARCESGDCAPEPSSVCPAALQDAMRACLADVYENDPEWFYSRTKRDLVEQCADAEAIAPAFDALCATAGSGVCGLTLDALQTQVMPSCVAEVWNAELDSACVLGDRYRDIVRSGALVILAERAMSVSTTLSALEQEQVLEAVRSSAYDDVMSLEEAYAAVDRGTVYQTDVWDASNRRAFTAYEFGAGDNSYGLVFEQGSTAVAARIRDGDLEGCAVYWGPERRDCASDIECAPGLRCQGVAPEIRRGRCLAETSSGDIGEPCGDGCSAGLICAAEQCHDASIAGSFSIEPALLIPDNAPAGAEAQLVAYGLASVDVRVELDLVIAHPRIRDLRVTLINPAGAEVVVFDRASDGTELHFDGRVVPFSGDEQVNGVWRLRAVDMRSSRNGAIGHFGLRIVSRWD